eukprot:Partr_v1_DN27978_c0_g2_i2_m11712 putative ubiquitin-conjugating enzyme
MDESHKAKANVTHKNPAVKRLLSELRELQQEPSGDFFASPLNDSDLFEWHFTIAGPADTEFQGGMYHGRILLPFDYPFKPPSIVLLTPNGRFEVGKKICLTITGYHPEFWQPAWGIRTALLALISFFPTKAEGAIGGIDWTPDERKALAKKSVEWRCTGCDAKNCDLLQAIDPANASLRAPKEDDVDLSMFKPAYAKDAELKTEDEASSSNINSLPDDSPVRKRPVAISNGPPALATPSLSVRNPRTLLSREKILDVLLIVISLILAFYLIRILVIYLG